VGLFRYLEQQDQLLSPMYAFSCRLTGGRNSLPAGLSSFDSRALLGNSVRRVGSNFPPRSDLRSELRRGPVPNIAHSFVRCFERYPSGGGRMRYVDFRGWVAIFAAQCWS
jgi:hypothetical protein